ncbi:MAG: type II secretion system protein [Rickettsiales bacterium]
MRHNRQSAYTLLELSVVLVILSLMMAGALAMLTQKSRIDQMKELRIKMQAIEEGLIAYTKRSNTAALPCPAPFYAITHASFGVANPSGCAGMTYDDPSSVAGTVPVKTIGLPDSYAFDPWGNQFTYVVEKASATTNALTTNPISSSGLGSITVKDTNDNNITTTAIVVLISHGPDGFGAFIRKGTRKSGYSSNAMQQKNCHCDEDGADDTYDSIFYAGQNTLDITDSEDRFDDIVIHFERSSFPVGEDLVVD